MNSIHDYINHYKLKPHPEGGYYAETYRSAQAVQPGAPFNGPRNWSTAIYFLLVQGNFSALHRIQSDELWHFYAGDAVEIIELHDNGELCLVSLGSNVQAGEVFQHVVKAGVWFACKGRGQFCAYRLHGIAGI